jgi:hypothetical protein
MRGEGTQAADGSSPLIPGRPSLKMSGSLRSLRLCEALDDGRLTCMEPQFDLTELKGPAP